MEFPEQEVVRLLKDGPLHAGRIRNKLNGFPLGMDVSLDYVERALRHLEVTYVVECMWRLKKTPIQSDPPGGAPRSTDPQSNEPSEPH